MGQTRAERDDAVSSRVSAVRLRSLARRHLERWGLVDPVVLERAAERLADAVLAREARETPGGDDASSFARMRALAERWIAEFAGGCSDPRRHWIWQAGTLLRRFPGTFLETPLPEPSAFQGEDGFLAILPERDPSVIRQQVIAGPIEAVIHALREAARRARSAVLDEEPQTLADPAG